MEDISEFILKINTENYSELINNRISDISEKFDDFIESKRIFLEKKIEKNSNPKYTDPINKSNITFYQYYKNQLIKLENNPQKLINEEIENLEQIKLENTDNGN